jgi:hypothetical protein
VDQPIRPSRKTDKEATLFCTPAASAIFSSLVSVPEILSLYVTEEPGSVYVVAVVPEKNFTVERTVYDKQLEIIDACPGVKLSLRVISLRGRRVSDIITPSSKPLFQRT